MGADGDGGHGHAEQFGVSGFCIERGDSYIGGVRLRAWGTLTEMVSRTCC